MSKDVAIIQKSRIGQTKSHLKLQLGANSSRQVECIAFGWGEMEDAFQIDSLLDVCYNVQVNHFAGMERAQAVLMDARVASGGLTEVSGE